MAKTNKPTYQDIINELRAGSFKPVYLLMGDESYFIDEISGYIEENAVPEDLRDFNQTIVYGADVTAAQIADMARRYPVMAERQLIVVREAKDVRDIEILAPYVAQPMQSTILVLCYKNGRVDRRKKLASEVEKHGVLFESAKLRDRQLPAFVSNYLKVRGADIDYKSAELMSEYVGTDLSRMSGELDKLVLALPEGSSRITSELIEENIGISREYNVFELKSALAVRDSEKTWRIVRNFMDNPKDNPIQMVLAVLYGFFSKLMVAYYAPRRDQEGISNFLGLRSPWQAREYVDAMRHYTGTKVMHIISDIRYYDARSKGVGNSGTGGPELLREFIYRVLH